MPRTISGAFADGTPFTLNNVPNDATPEQVHAEVDRQGATHTAKPRADATIVPTPKATLAPTAPAPVEPTLTKAERWLGMAGEDITTKPGALGEAYYELIGRPAADFNAFRFGISPRLGVEPGEYKRERIAGGAPGAARLREDVPKGWLDNISAVTAPLQVGLLTTPYGTALFGASVVARRLKHNDALADKIEMIGSLPMIATDVARGIRGLRGAPPRVKAYGEALTSTLAGGVTETARAEEAAQKGATLARAQQAEEAIKTQVTTAIDDAQTAAANAEQAARANLAQARGAHEAAAAELETRLDRLRPPRTEVDQLLGLGPSSTTPEQAGAIAKEAAPVIRSRQSQAVTAAFGKGEQASSAAGLRLNEDDGSLLAVHEAAQDWYRHTATDPRTTATERTLAERFYHLGLDHYEIPGTASTLTPEQAQEAVHAGQLNWAQLKPVYRDVPHAELSKMYAQLANIAGSPEQYALSTNFARREFYRLKNTVKGSLRALELGDADTARLMGDARQLVRRTQMPTLKETLGRIISPRKTSTEAFRVIGSIDDPVHLRRMIENGSEAEGQAYREAWLNNFLEKHFTGDRPVETLVRDWDTKVHPEIRYLVTSASNLNVKQGFDELRARRLAAQTGEATVERTKLARTAAREALTTESQRSRRLVKQVTTAGRQATMPVVAARKVAQRDVRDALSALKDAMREAERSAVAAEHLGRQPAKGRVLSVGQNRSGTWGLLLGGIGGAQVTSGTPRGVILGTLHLAMSYLILKKPRLVAEAFRTPLDTPRGAQLALALRLLLQGWRGTGPAPQANAPTPTP